MNESTAVTLALALLALLVAYPMVRSGRGRATIELLRSELEVETAARLAQEARCQTQISALTSKHDRELGEVHGKLTVITTSFADTIAMKVVEALQAGGHL